MAGACNVAIAAVATSLADVRGSPSAVLSYRHGDAPEPGQELPPELAAALGPAAPAETALRELVGQLPSWFGAPSTCLPDAVAVWTERIHAEQVRHWIIVREEDRASFAGNREALLVDRVREAAPQSDPFGLETALVPRLNFSSRWVGAGPLDLYRRVVRITYPGNADESVSSCSGLLLDDRHVLTNGHCVISTDVARLGLGYGCCAPDDPDCVIRADRCHAYTVDLRFTAEDVAAGLDSSRAVARAVFASLDPDVAILLLSRPVDVAELAPVELFPSCAPQSTAGRSLSLLGHPEGDFLNLSDDRCAVFSDEDARSGAIGHTCYTLPGSSGSPILLAREQWLLGVHFRNSDVEALRRQAPRLEAAYRAFICGQQDIPRGDPVRCVRPDVSPKEAVPVWRILQTVCSGGSPGSRAACGIIKPLLAPGGVASCEH